MSLIVRVWRHITYRDMPRQGGATYLDMHRAVYFPETFQPQTTTVRTTDPRSTR